jgi:hypothetical protein
MSRRVPGRDGTPPYRGVRLSRCPDQSEAIESPMSQIYATSNIPPLMNIVKYNPMEIWPGVLERIANGQSLASALRGPGMPSYALAKKHLREVPGLREAYEQANEDRAALLAEELIELADTPIPEDLDPVSRSAWVQHLRIRLDTRKWIASRVYRQVYGDKLDLSMNHVNVDLTAAMEEAQRRLDAIRQRTIDERA